MDVAILKVAVIRRAEALVEERSQDLARMIRNEITEAMNGD